MVTNNSSIPNEDELLVARAIRAQLERDVNPGNSVNATANPFQIALTGSYDLIRLARAVLESQAGLAAHRKALADKAAAAQKVADDAAKLAADKAAADKAAADALV